MRIIGVSNVFRSTIAAFHAVCPITACQPPYNMLQRQIENDLLPWCRERSCLAHRLLAPDERTVQPASSPATMLPVPKMDVPKYPMFQGEEWQKNQDFVDELRAIAAETDVFARSRKSSSTGRCISSRASPSLLRAGPLTARPDSRQRGRDGVDHESNAS